MLPYLLTAQAMKSAEQAAIASGVRGEQLMEEAGLAAAQIIMQHYPKQPTLVFCGSGNNGGDGYVVARILRENQWPITVIHVGDVNGIHGDARTAKNKWHDAGGTIISYVSGILDEHTLAVDAIFGIGLNRNIEGEIANIINDTNNSQISVVAIDIPSGIHCDTATIMATAIKAEHTITFQRPKFGHVLLPGKLYTGELHVADIGIASEFFNVTTYVNEPALWQHNFPMPDLDAHKYTRGHALVVGGEAASSGAAKLASTSALRMGAGLVSVACSHDALLAYAAGLTSVMTKPCRNAVDLERLLEDPRINAVLIGPGCGVTNHTREQVEQILVHQKPTVLDADALSVFATNPKNLFRSIKGTVVLTPHEGEFKRLFNENGAKHERALAAAKQSNAAVVFKGSDTVIASPDGRVCVNTHAPVWLATAGSGDVLSGMITGLLAQKMPAFEAACAAVWMHSQAALAFGPGLISEDLPNLLPSVLKNFYYDL